MFIVSIGGRVDTNDSECHIETTVFQEIICLYATCWFRHLHDLPSKSRAGASVGASPYLTNGVSQCLQIFLHQRICDRALAYCGRDTMTGSIAHIARRENSRRGRFQ